MSIWNDSSRNVPHGPNQDDSDQLSPLVTLSSDKLCNIEVRNQIIVIDNERAARLLLLFSNGLQNQPGRIFKYIKDILEILACSIRK